MAILEPSNRAYYVKKFNPVRQSVPAGGPEWGMNVIAGKPLSGLHLDLTNIPRIRIFNYGGMPRRMVDIAYAGREGR